MVKTVKNIPLSRMVYMLPPARGIPNNKWNKNLSFVGVYNNGTVKLEPTTAFCWEWEPIEYYWAKLVEEVKNAVDPKDGTPLSVLKETIFVPPSMKNTDLGVFLRKYPESFQLEVNTCGAVSDIMVKLNGANGEYSMPTWT
jgi:hypothetical protein